MRKWSLKEPKWTALVRVDLPASLVRHSRKPSTCEDPAPRRRENIHIRNVQVFLMHSLMGNFKSRSHLRNKFFAFVFSLISSVPQLRLTLCDIMNRSTPGLPVHHQLPEFTLTHIHQVSDAIQPSLPLSSPFPPALSLSQHQGLFQWVSSSHQVAKVLEFQLQYQSFQWTPRTDLL